MRTNTPITGRATITDADCRALRELTQVLRAFQL